MTAMVCSGDSGIYGMAGLMYEIGEEYPEVEIEVLPGVTAAMGGAASAWCTSWTRLLYDQFK